MIDRKIYCLKQLSVWLIMGHRTGKYFFEHSVSFLCNIALFLSALIIFLCNINFFLLTWNTFSCNINLFLSTQGYILHSMKLLYWHKIDFRAAPSFCFGHCSLFRKLFHGDIFLLSRRNNDIIPCQKKIYFLWHKKLFSFFACPNFLY